MKIINIGIVAHVDAGKTTVTENLLYLSGAIKTMGRVDSGNTQTDSMELERRRGITIKASAISFDWNDVKVNIIDTPGHVDFISEVERSLSVLDGAILVISAAEGIQSQTRILFNTLKALKIPTMIFINKLDRSGADYQKVFQDIKNTMTDKLVSIQTAADEGTRYVTIKDFENIQASDSAINVLSELDEKFLENYINGIANDEKEISKKLATYSRKGELYMVFCGAAAIGIGIKSLLDGICSYLPCTEADSYGELSASVFKIERTNNNGKKVYLRLFQGEIAVRDKIQIPNGDIVEKVKKIELLKEGKHTESSRVGAGDIGILYGLTSFKVGDFIGKPSLTMKKVSIAKPTFRITVSPMDVSKKEELFKVLSLLAEEDPMLELGMEDRSKDIYVNLFGEVQMDILSDLLEENYGIKVEFSNIQTIYKETPIGVGEAVMHMNQGFNVFWATVGLKVEPLMRGEGLKYVSEVSIGSLPKSFQNAIEEAVIATSKQGLLGWEVTDMKVTLTYGKFSSVMSTPADFRNTTPMVFMEALNEGKTKLLEPIQEFELRIPQGVLSKAAWDLETMRASFENPTIQGDEFFIKGLIPAENSKQYNLKIASYTEGKGMFLTRFFGYKELPEGLAKTREKTGYDPLNKKEYLLHKLNAIRD
ncbi:tetracycline resistance ribosomal protection protein [Clostridium sp. 19966]|uniref:tetracycline resistance ribosomal protection protein n=1 Tax=Clostridium sp. 19966 TaxID=2768166 RepID=UPI0028DFCFE4|nr:tetracycline resistance ribosomal protection protein [Clostridium sp. 19966]MDT8717479.1 tetracycline resistance ribosomal protection protein [Clostridium sp. 19966]